MNLAADCYDNAFMESCFGTINREPELTGYKNHRDDKAEVSGYLHYYNFERKRPSLDYINSVQFESIINSLK